MAEKSDDKRESRGRCPGFILEAAGSAALWVMPAQKLRLLNIDGLLH